MIQINFESNAKKESDYGNPKNWTLVLFTRSSYFDASVSPLATNMAFIT